MRNPIHLVEADRFFHIEAIARDGAPSDARRQSLCELLACWRPKPDVWTQPAVAVALATEAVNAAPAFASAIKDWFASASVDDRLALVYDQRNDAADRPGASHELVEAWLLHRFATQEASSQGRSLAWPVPQLAREAKAAERTILQEAVAGDCPAAYVPLLLAAGEDASVRDARGATALHWAAAIAPDLEEDDGAPYSFLAQALLDAGADVDARENRGLTPLDVALHRENWGAVRTLIHAGALMTEEEQTEAFELADDMGWHEVAEWRARSVARSLDGALVQPAQSGAGGRVRM